MANFDGGHYFLTALIPINRGVVTEHDGADRSPQQILRQTLSTLPVAQQDLPALESELNSPFAQVPGTHFLRFFIIDELRFNGRSPSNPIYDLLAQVNMLKAEPVDDLIDPYLVLSIDFDAANGDDASLRAYTDQLWFHTRNALDDVLHHCVGYEKVTDATSFFIYIKKCQIKTTMPFTDYWTVPMPKWALPGLLAKSLGVVGLMALAIAISGLWPGGPLGLIGWTIAVALVVTFITIIKVGTAVWPKAPHSDLQSVLKALYVQQQFVNFATTQQGIDDQALYDAFGSFCKDTRPSDLKQPTQTAGTPYSRRTTS